MYRIVTKEALKPTVILYEIEAPMVARKAQPGQFIILRVDENGERIPITIHDYNREKGTVTIIVQTVGATTEKLSHKQQGEYLHDFVGPLGKPTETEGKKKVCVVGGGVGCAIAYPVLKKFHDCGAEVHAVVGFKNKDVVILEDKFKAVSSVLKVCTDDGSYGQKGLVTEALKQLLDEGVIRYAGISRVNNEQIDTARAMLGDKLIAVQNQFSPSHPDPEHTMGHCRELGLAFVCWSPLGGFLDAFDQRAYDPFRAVAGEHGCSYQRVVLAWELAQYERLYTIPSARNPHEINDSFAATGLELTCDELARLNRAVFGGSRLR